MSSNRSIRQGFHPLGDDAPPDSLDLARVSRARLALILAVIFLVVAAVGTLIGLLEQATPVRP